MALMVSCSCGFQPHKLGTVARLALVGVLRMVSCRSRTSTACTLPNGNTPSAG